MSEGKRYVSGSATERVPAGGGYDEWFEIRLVPELGTALDVSMTGQDGTKPDHELSDAENAVREEQANKARTSALFASMIIDWSLVGADGNKLPINAVTVRNLDLDLAAPIMPYLEAYANAFLVLRSLTMKGS